MVRLRGFDQGRGKCGMLTRVKELALQWEVSIFYLPLKSTDKFLGVPKPRNFGG